MSLFAGGGVMPKIKSGKSPSRIALACLIPAIILAVTCVAQVDEPASKLEGQDKDKKQDMSPVRVVMKTSLGDIVIELDREKAPVTCANFLNYIDKKFYDGIIFHRVIPHFVIQGGGFTSDMQKKPTEAPIENEWQNGLKNVRGTLSMARLGGKPNSATSQFFINVKDNPSLDKPGDGAAYAVFARVVDGMDVVDKIRKVETASRQGHRDVPVKPVMIEKVVRLADTSPSNKCDKDKPDADK